MKILMVCLGNICRSPLAEGILQSKISEAHLVDSAGTSGYHNGELPDERSIKVAEQNGIDITNQRSRKFELSDFDEFDLIYAMDQSNYNNLKNLTKSPEYHNKIELILNEIYPNENQKVPDPYYGGEDGFTNVFNLLDDATDAIVKKYNLQ